MEKGSCGFAFIKQTGEIGTIKLKGDKYRMYAHEHIGLYRFIRDRLKLNLNSTEFLYHFLLGNHEFHRALTDNLRSSLGVQGMLNNLQSPNWLTKLLISEKLSQIMRYVGIAADSMNALQIVYELTEAYSCVSNERTNASFAIPDQEQSPC